MGHIEGMGGVDKEWFVESISRKKVSFISNSHPFAVAISKPQGEDRSECARSFSLNIISAH